MQMIWLVAKERLLKILSRLNFSEINDQLPVDDLRWLTSFSNLHLHLAFGGSSLVQIKPRSKSRIVVNAVKEPYLSIRQSPQMYEFSIRIKERE